MRFVLRGMEVRSMEVMVVVVWLQVTPVNEQGFWFGSQSWRRDGFGRVALKFNSCVAGSLEREEEAHQHGLG